MLHILNGDATLVPFQQAAIAGEVLVWRDILMEGPVPDRLATTVAWERRAIALQRQLGIAGDAYIAAIRASLERVATLDASSPVTLWFEYDLHCVVHLCFLVDRLSKRAVRPALVCPVEPLGTASPQTLAALYAARQPLTEEQTRLAHRFWQAYASPDPEAMPLLLDAARDSWPELAGAALAHLRRYPAIGSGRSEVEETLVAILADGEPHPFPLLLAAVTNASTHRLRDDVAARTVTHAPSALPSLPLGMGDSTLAALLHEHASHAQPLIQLEGGDRERFADWRVSLTAHGRSADWWRSGARDRWLGGVHLHGASVPRWDAARQTLVPV